VNDEEDGYNPAGCNAVTGQNGDENLLCPALDFLIFRPAIPITNHVLYWRFVF